MRKRQDKGNGKSLVPSEKQHDGGGQKRKRAKQGKSSPHAQPAKGNTKPVKPQSVSFLQLWPGLLVLTLLIGLWAVVLGQRTTPLVALPDPPKLLTPSIVFEREALFSEELVPILDASKRRNHQAAERAVRGVHDVFRNYRAGIAPFVEDISSLGTRAKIAWRMPKDWLSDSNGVQQIVLEKYERHIFSEAKLNRDIAAIFAAYREDLLAGDNQMRGQVRIAIAAAALPHLPVSDFERYHREFDAALTTFSTQRARESVYQGLAILVTSEVASVTAYKIAQQVSANTGTRVAALAMSRGGAAAGGAAAGSALGSVIPGPGTIIGLGVGLVAGICVDWWMNDRFQDKLTSEMSTYVNRLETQMLNGTLNEPGIREALMRFADEWSAMQHRAVRQTILEVG